ncbi:MAG: hypothetical protein ACFB00_04020 [Parvularculaceae bacterium]
MNFFRTGARAAAALGVVMGASHAASYPQPPLEAYGALPFAHTAALSPNGEMLAFLDHTDGMDSSGSTISTPDP